MNHLFETAISESLGIPALSIKSFLKRLEEQELPMHSAIIMRHDKEIGRAHV